MPIPWLAEFTLSGRYKGLLKLPELESNLELLVDHRDQLGAAELPILFLHSVLSARNAAGLKSAVDLTDALLKTNLGPDDIKELYDLVLAKATSASKGNTAKDPDAKAGSKNDYQLPLARLNFLRGRLIAENSSVLWPFNDQGEEIFKAYKSAAELDPNNAEYVTYLGFARLDRRTPSSTRPRPTRVPRSSSTRIITAVTGCAEGRLRAPGNLRAERRGALSHGDRRRPESGRVGRDAKSRLHYQIDLANSRVQLANYCYEVDKKDQIKPLLGDAIKAMETEMRDPAFDKQTYADYAWAGAASARRSGLSARRGRRRQLQRRDRRFPARLRSEQSAAAAQSRSGALLRETARVRQAEGQFDEGRRSAGDRGCQGSRLRARRRSGGSARRISCSKTTRRARAFRRGTATGAGQEAPELALYTRLWVSAALDDDKFDKSQLREEINAELPQRPPTRKNATA